ncbi:hypothetical protein AAMO2058_000599200 [Amorphochlora amoebiformis]
MESLRLIDDRVNISRSVSRRNSLRSASHITEYYEDDRIVEELSVILQDPAQLDLVPEYVSRFSEQHKTVQSQLTSHYERCLSDQIMSYGTLPRSKDILNDIQHNLFLVVKDAGRHGILIGADKKLLRDVKVICRNLNSVENLLKRLSAVPRKLERLNELLDKMGEDQERVPKIDQKIKDIYIEVRNLVLLRNSMWKEGAHSTEFIAQMHEEFDGINQVTERLEKTLLANIDDTLALCKSDPSTLIRTLMVVEMEERAKSKVFVPSPVPRVMDTDTKTGYKSPRNVVAQMTIKEKVINQLEYSIADTFQKMLSNSLLGSTGLSSPGTTQTTDEVLEVLDTLIGDLFLVKEDVSVLYPPEYNITEFFQKRYTKFIMIDLNTRLSSAEDLSQSDLLKWSSWIHRFKTQMVALGFAIPRDLEDQIVRLAQTYKLKSYDHLRAPIEKTIELEIKEEPKIDANGIPKTQGPRDIFGIIHRHWDNVLSSQVTEEMNAKAIIEVAKTYSGSLIYYQRCQMRFLKKLDYVEMKTDTDDSTSLRILIDGQPKSEDYMCAWINSSIMYETFTGELRITMTKELKKRQSAGDLDAKALKTVSNELHSILDIAGQGFRRVKEAATDGLAGYIVALCSDVLDGMFAPKWVKLKNGDDNSKLLEYLEEVQLAVTDYVEKLETKELKSLMAERLLRISVEAYCLKYLSKKKKLNDDFRAAHVKALERDRRAIFLHLLRGKEEGKSDVYTYQKPMLMTCFSVFDLMTSYIRIQSPSTAITLLQKKFNEIVDKLDSRATTFVVNILKVRSDVSSNDQRKIIKVFKEVWSDYETSKVQKSTDTIAQNMKLPWCSFAQDAEVATKSPPKYSKWLGLGLVASFLPAGELDTPPRSPLRSPPSGPIASTAPKPSHERKESTVDVTVIGLDDFLS